jgi:hypothetical protein
MNHSVWHAVAQRRQGKTAQMGVIPTYDVRGRLRTTLHLGLSCGPRGTGPSDIRKVSDSPRENAKDSRLCSPCPGGAGNVHRGSGGRET